MKETVQEYIARIQGKIAGKDPLRVQSATAKKLAGLLRGKNAAKLRKRPAPDKWSVAEILAHLADAEIVTSWRIRSILGAPGTSLQAFDQNAWAATGKYAKRDARKSLEQFRVLREGNLALFKSLTPEQWKHSGMHAERGEESIETILLRIAGHDLNHLEQVAGLLAKKN
jgi:hypothetical protein